MTEPEKVDPSMACFGLGLPLLLVVPLVMGCTSRSARRVLRQQASGGFGARDDSDLRWRRATTGGGDYAVIRPVVRFLDNGGAPYNLFGVL
jgi:hypothetical protein